MEAEARTFDPARHLSLISGNEYLEVKWRLVWLRTEHPEASIETELISHTNNVAVVRASVIIPDGGGSSTGLGMEAAGNFGDYLEKAETKAIGRALGALGYGTQFCSDFDFGAAAGKVVDSPVGNQPRYATENHPIHPTPMQHANKIINQRQQYGGGTSDAATEKQMNMIQSLGGVMQDGMTKKQASAYIDELMQEKGMEPREAPQQQQQRQPFTGTISNPDAPATDAQKNFLKNEWQRKYGDLGDEGLVSFIAQQTSAPAQELTKGEASRLINGVKDGTLKPSAPF